MKNKALLVGLLIMLCTATFAQTDYAQFEVMYIKPKLDKIDLFKKGMSAHNKKYHAAAPYKAGVSYVASGPNSGSYIWVMGPTTWTQLDGAPGAGEHMTDWEKNVNPNVESMGENMYWRAVKDVSYDPEGAATFKKTRMRASIVFPGQMDRFIEQMKKVVAVYKAKKYNASFSMASRQGATQGVNVVTFTSFANYAWFDADIKFIKDFDEVNGVDAYRKFIEELDLCVDRAKTYDELHETTDLGG